MRCAIAALLVVFLVACAVPAARANLPPYKAPGSFIGVFSGQGPSFPEALMASLWDGTDGSVYTTVVGHNQFFSTFTVSIAERAALLIYYDYVNETQGASYVSMLTYAPRSAPAMGATCTLPAVQGANWAGWVMNGAAYLLNGATVSRVAFNGATCILSAVATLPTSYADNGAMSVAPGHVSLITAAGTLTELWWSAKGNVSVTSQTNAPSGGTWLYLQEDASTGTLYLTSTLMNYTMSFYAGVRAAPKGPVTWSPMLYWSGLDPGSFGIDSRYNSVYNGPLFCSTDSFSDPACYTVYAQTIWQGPKLAPAAGPASGMLTSPLYDPTCN